MTDGDFSAYPKTLGEARAAKNGHADDWAPRDLLIALLREIDSGEVDIDALVISFRQRKPDGNYTGHFRVASPDPFVSIGLLRITEFKMQE